MSEEYNILHESGKTTITTELRGKVLEVELENFLNWAKACHWIAFTEETKETMIKMYLRK